MDEHISHPPRPEGWEREIYPMPAFPMLAVSDLERSSHWYQDALGFVDVFTMRGHDGAPFLAHLRWCRFGDLLLTSARSALGDSPGRGVTLNFATSSTDEVAERASAAGARIVEGPIDRPWNTREITILDPDGYRLNFTAPHPDVVRNGSGSLEDVVERMRAEAPPASVR